MVDSFRLTVSIEGAYYFLTRSGWIRTSECRSQSPVPYRLATPLYSVLPALQPPLTVKLIIE